MGLGSGDSGEQLGYARYKGLFQAGADLNRAHIPSLPLGPPWLLSLPVPQCPQSSLPTADQPKGTPR